MSDAKIILTTAQTNRDSISKAVIEKGAASIGDEAFYGCGSLTDIYCRGSEMEWLEFYESD